MTKRKQSPPVWELTFIRRYPTSEHPDHEEHLVEQAAPLLADGWEPFAVVDQAPIPLTWPSHPLTLWLRRRAA